MSKEKTLDFEVIDDDFEQASRYYAATAFGKPKDVTKAYLKERYEKEEILDPLVFLMGQHRVVHSTPQVSPPTPTVAAVLPKCTCISDLAHDAYGPGGPSSGQALPVCLVHNRTFKE